MMTLTYQLGDKLYLNITNRCNCACEFCIRGGHDGVGDGENLWLEHEPSASEVISELEKRDLTAYKEVVFCGYGEPTENFDAMLKICRWLKDNAKAVPVRLNTNGLCDLSAGKPVAHLLEGLIDIVSISLNAPDAKRYQEITRSAFGEAAFDAMLAFAVDCKKYIPKTLFTVVDVLTDDETARCEKLADSMGIAFRVRRMV